MLIILLKANEERDSLGQDFNSCISEHRGGLPITPIFLFVFLQPTPF